MSATGGNSILDTIGKIGGNSGGENGQQDWWKILGDIGGYAANTSAGRAEGRQAQANFNLQSNQAQQGANVQTADANLRQRSAAMAEALRGRMLQGTTDATITGTPYGVKPPNVTGGLRPSNIVGAADLGKSLAAHGDANLASSGMKPVNFDNLAPKPNGYDSVLNALGATGGILGTVGQVAGGVAGAGAAGGAAAGLSAAAGPLAAIPLGIMAGKAVVSLARRLGGNDTNRQREEFAKQLIGTNDTNAFDAYLRTNLDPATAQELIYRAHRVIGRNDSNANEQWMSDVSAALQRGKGANTSTNFDPLTGQVR